MISHWFHADLFIVCSFSFAPSIVASLGYTANKVQLMNVPPFAVAFLGEIYSHIARLNFTDVVPLYYRITQSA